MNDIVEPIDPDNPNYYVDKETMRLALRDYRDACQKAEAAGEEVPIVPEYIAGCFLKIARGLSMKYNFRRYSFVDDMVSDGVMTCLRYIRSFDPDKISVRTGKPVSAFSYFTQTCFYAFVNRIKEEEHETDVKRALVFQSGIDTFSLQDVDEGDYQVSLIDFINSLGPEKEKKEKKPPAKKSTKPSLEDFT